MRVLNQLSVDHLSIHDVGGAAGFLANDLIDDFSVDDFGFDVRQMIMAPVIVPNRAGRTAVGVTCTISARSRVA